MPRHEFGIMRIAPEKGIRYDRYEPQKYDCISVDDDDLTPLLERLGWIRCYWHTLDRPEFGLSYCGITLIPPESLDAFLETVWDRSALSDLAALLKQAEDTQSFVIHFGI